MGVTTNPAATGVPTTPNVVNPNVTVNPLTSGIAPVRADVNRTGLNAGVDRTGASPIQSARDALLQILNDGSTVANYRMNEGLTGTTNCSAWANQIGAAPSLVKVDANGPAIQTDGSLLFDGAAHSMQMTTTLAQPETVYLVAQQITWTSLDKLTDGYDGTGRAPLLQQLTATPNLLMQAGGAGIDNAEMTLATYHVVTMVMNGASSSVTVNRGTPATADAGADGGNGITLGSDFTGGRNAHMQVRELIIRNVADSAATQAKIQALLQQIHGTP